MANNRREQYPFDDLVGQRSTYSTENEPDFQRTRSESPQRQTGNPTYQRPQRNSPQGSPRGYTRSRRRRQNRLILIWTGIVIFLASITGLLGKMVADAGSSGDKTQTSEILTSANLELTGSEQQTGGSGLAAAAQLSDSQTESESSASEEDTETPVKGIFDDRPPSADNPVIALTFDDGPSGTLTPQLLDTLKDKEVKATFFLLGSQIDANDPAIIKRMVDEGHEIANHSYTHSRFIDISEDMVKKEIEDTNNTIFQAAGVYPTCVRPPTGAQNDKILAIAESFNLPVVNWSYQSCPEDWLPENQDSVKIANYVIENGANGHIVLLHDIHEWTVNSIPSMIDGLREKGFRFATISELMYYHKDEYKPGGLYWLAEFE